MSVLRHPAVHGAGGFALMGGWAVFANRGHPMPAPLVAGLVQGGLTAVITLGLKRIVEAVAEGVPGAAGYALAPAAAFAVSLCMLGLVHWLAGTPEIRATIAVPLAVSTVYAALYAAAVKRG